MNAVLDSWAITALLDGEPAAPRVEQAITGADAGMSSINLGEVYYVMARRRGPGPAVQIVEGLRGVVTVEDPDWLLVRAAAEIKTNGRLSYADAFCVATAIRHRAPLYTGDPEIIGLDAGIEVIDLRSTV